MIYDIRGNNARVKYRRNIFKNPFINIPGILLTQALFNNLESSQC